MAKKPSTPYHQTNGARPGCRISKDQAVIHTASIDVKILRLNKRQLTLAVFRQLEEELIFLADGSLRGLPWGKINYTWKENRPGTAFHVIYQVGDTLYRSPVPGKQVVNGDVVDWLYDGESPQVLDSIRQSDITEPIAICEWWLEELEHRLDHGKPAREHYNLHKGTWLWDKECDVGLFWNRSREDHDFALEQDRFPGWEYEVGSWLDAYSILSNPEVSGLIEEDEGDECGTKHTYWRLPNPRATVTEVNKQLRDLANGIQAIETRLKKDRQAQVSAEENMQKYFFQRVAEMEQLDQLFIGV